MEVWKDIPGYEGKYQVSDQGRVKSFVRAPTGILLRPGKSSNGYFTVALFRRSHTIHSLVAAAFIGPRPEGMEVRHLDGDRTNSTLANLSYCTPSENAADKIRHGTHMVGEKYPNAKLNDVAAYEIRLLRYRIPQSELARQYGASPAAIQAIHDGRTWRHV